MHSGYRGKDEGRFLVSRLGGQLSGELDQVIAKRCQRQRVEKEPFFLVASAYAQFVLRALALVDHKQNQNR